MATYPPILAGQRLTAALLSSMIPNIVVKGTTQTVNNSVVLVPDDELFLPVEAGAVYDVTAWLVHSSAIAGDIAIGWTAPAGSTFTWGVQGPATSATTTATASESNFQQRNLGDSAGLGGGAGTAVCTDARGVLTTGSNAGTLRVTFAQNTINVSDTQMRAGSTLRLKRVA
ncbi:hypothetical protein ACFV6Z_15330 [Streptomyces sp. NPDC059818]|uniref:hypothetical protein n=1 Tax=Streptomyces sp. NPDC059818 TaxID=3346962 RepID=UPI00364D5647